MIKVQIAENISVVSAIVNEKNSLEILVKSGQDVDLFAAMNSGDSIEQEEQKFLFFPVDNKWYGKEATSKEMVMKLRQLSAQFQELLSVDVSEKDFAFNMFEGTPIKSTADIDVHITKEAVYSRIGLNIFNNVVKHVKNVKSPIRLKLVRQSANKHFATIPQALTFTKEGKEIRSKFVESMVIPKDQSKLAYSKYEMDKGLNNPNSVQADSQPSGAEDLPFTL